MASINDTPPPKAAKPQAAGTSPLVAVLLVAIAAGLAVLVVDSLSAPSYEYRIISPSDSTFDVEMEAAGSQGYRVVSARRAIGIDGESSYEMILMRETR